MIKMFLQLFLFYSILFEIAIEGIFLGHSFWL